MAKTWQKCRKYELIHDIHNLKRCQRNLVKTFTFYITIMIKKPILSDRDKKKVLSAKKKQKVVLKNLLVQPFERYW